MITKLVNQLLLTLLQLTFGIEGLEIQSTAAIVEDLISAKEEQDNVINEIRLRLSQINYLPCLWLSRSFLFFIQNHLLHCQMAADQLDDIMTKIMSTYSYEDLWGQTQCPPWLPNLRGMLTKNKPSSQLPKNIKNRLFDACLIFFSI